MANGHDLLPSSTIDEPSSTELVKFVGENKLSLFPTPVRPTTLGNRVGDNSLAKMEGTRGMIIYHCP
jgi:hypothetical protein